MDDGYRPQNSVVHLSSSNVGICRNTGGNNESAYLAASTFAKNVIDMSPMSSYKALVAEFLSDDVQTHSPHLNLHNPHFSKDISHLFLDRKGLLDWLHNADDRVLEVQFIGSHYSNLGWFSGKKQVVLSSAEDPFNARLSRLGIKSRFRIGNCALGYFPGLKGSTGHLTRQQTEYLQPKKILEYQVSKTRAVFTLGQPSLDFHLHGTDIEANKFSETIDSGCVQLPSGLFVVPLPHPANQGILNYMRARGASDMSRDAQDAEFLRLANKGLEHLRKVQKFPFCEALKKASGAN